MQLARMLVIKSGTYWTGRRIIATRVPRRTPMTTEHLLIDFPMRGSQTIIDNHALRLFKIKRRALLRFDTDLQIESKTIGTKPCRARSNLKKDDSSLRRSPSNYFPQTVFVDVFSSTTKKPRVSLCSLSECSTIESVLFTIECNRSRRHEIWFENRVFSSRPPHVIFCEIDWEEDESILGFFFASKEKYVNLKKEVGSWKGFVRRFFYSFLSKKCRISLKGFVMSLIMLT